MQDWKNIGMKWFSRMIGLLVVGVFLWGCETLPFQTLTIFDGPNRVEALQVMPNAYEEKGYDHPVTMTEAEMLNILRGGSGLNRDCSALWVRAKAGVSRFLAKGRGGKILCPPFRQRVESSNPGRTSDFFETVELSTEYQGTTSGGLFVTGGALHVILRII